jgi:hypothetical protein
MSRVLEAWDQLLRQAVSRDFDEQQYALFQIGLVLQRHNPHVQPETDVYEQELSRDLLRLALDEGRQRDTVTYLCALAKNHPGAADGILYAMSNAQPGILIAPLLQLLKDMGNKLKGDAAYQALLALDGALRIGGQVVRDALQQYDLNELLEKWATSGDDLIVEKAGKVKRQIGRILET